MSKLVVIAGIKRSGSTWLYNAVRLCIEHAGYTYHIAGDGQYFDPECDKDFQIVKKHPFDPALAAAADYVFTSDRDDSGIRASWKRFSGEELSTDKLKLWRGWLDQWRKYQKDWTGVHIQFSTLPVYAMGYLSAISSILKPLNWNELEEVNADLENIKPPTDKDYNPVTLLFSNHITSQ